MQHIAEHVDLIHAIRSSLEDARLALDSLIGDIETISKVHEAGALIAETFCNQGRLFSCGNGGSMYDAMHFAEELSGRFRDDRPGLPAVAISDPGHLSGVSNDFGFELVFSSYLAAHGRSGDVLLAISTSGASQNILNAAATARDRGIKVVGLTGARQSPLAATSDIVLATPAGCYTDRVQELHIKVLHILIEMIERQLFPKNYDRAG